MEQCNKTEQSCELCEKKFSILQTISSFIAVTDNITSIANLMLDLAIDYTNAEKGSLMTLDEEGELSIRAAKGIDAGLFLEFRERIGEGIAGTVAEQKTPVLVENIDKDRRFSGKKRNHYKTKSFISCPIMYKGRLLGVFNINDKRDGSDFTVDELDLMQIISNQASIVLENAFLMSRLRAKAAGLQEINKTLIEFDNVKTEFFTRVSHELRTPLNSIKGSIYYLSKTLNPLSEGQREFCDIISSETNKLISISENLLDFLRFGHEGQKIKMTVFSLPALVREVADSSPLKKVLEEKKIQLQTETDGSLPHISGDRTKTFQFFSNLIEGLVYFLDRGDTITISFNEDDCLNIHISAPRPFPESVYQNIWNSTYIIPEDDSEEGLKFYLAWKVAEIHHWKVFAENREDRFHISVSIPGTEKIKSETMLS
jgi:K+-sensing histidine kinase KdpD